mmetsp:Transcript_137448/g.439086  ORF Transcript_137448/g.439086 Transcript_137448/m.439086 type:complete len:273 (-) Transcript_137448:1732-2550(-)
MDPPAVAFRRLRKLEQVGVDQTRQGEVHQRDQADAGGEGAEDQRHHEQQGKPSAAGADALRGLVLGLDELLGALGAEDGQEGRELHELRNPNERQTLNTPLHGHVAEVEVCAVRQRSRQQPDEPVRFLQNIYKCGEERVAHRCDQDDEDDQKSEIPLLQQELRVRLVGHLEKCFKDHREHRGNQAHEDGERQRAHKTVPHDDEARMILLDDVQGIALGDLFNSTDALDEEDKRHEREEETDNECLACQVFAHLQGRILVDVVPYYVGDVGRR